MLDAGDTGRRSQIHNEMTGKGFQGPVVIERHRRMKKKFAQVSSDIK
jgi:hypothetical protein